VSWIKSFRQQPACRTGRARGGKKSDRYYLLAATDRLNQLQWKSLKDFMAVDAPKMAGATWSQYRWDSHQKAFEIAVDCLARELED